jgi:hypothetical protein
MCWLSVYLRASRAQSPFYTRFTKREKAKARNIVLCTYHFDSIDVLIIFENTRARAMAPIHVLFSTWRVRMMIVVYKTQNDTVVFIRTSGIVKVHTREQSW